ncbi:MAG: DNA/RNA nuclease SfsA [Gammaproteobacteria bacterium]|nr:DNA/RNA nuclease SfsA [Gammaproteobacteria bacterium]
MKFSESLLQATLVKRYKRFLADIELESGEVITIHCPNTGSMRRCGTQGSPVWISRSDNPKRKYPHTWELVRVEGGHLACINTHRANALVKEAILAGDIKALCGYGSVRAEVPYGEERSRIDFLLDAHKQLPQCYVEVKSVTLGMEGGRGLFPDAVTTRGAKHLRELMAVKEKGARAVLFFCALNSGIESVEPADEIDPEYGQLLRESVKCGVEVMAYASEISPDAINLTHAIPVIL